MHFVLNRHPTSTKWRASSIFSIPCDALLTGYFVFETYLSNACASTSIFPTTDTVALALWAVIYSALLAAFSL